MAKVKGFLKAKNPSADFYKSEELIAAFARALDKEDKINLIESLSDKNIKEKY